MTRGALPSPGFWSGRRVLLTGHTGFKGTWLCAWLARLGATVTGVSLPPDTRPNLFDLNDTARHCDSRFCDIRDAAALASVVRAARPDVVLHLAAQSLVRESYRQPVATFATNVMGTAHLLDALRGLDSVRAAVVVTTDKVYRNLEHAYPYRETDPLGGHDPYSASKAAAEMVVASFRDALLAGQGVAVATARAGNVIGGGDWAAERLLPDAIRAWTRGDTLRIRRPEATRPWQHVLEPLTGYLVLAERLWADPACAGAWNFGPLPHEAATVRSVVEVARSAWGPPCEVVFDAAPAGPHEAGALALETALSRTRLGVEPRWPLPTAVARTIDWYRRQAEGAGAHALCDAEIGAYEAAA